jgi:DNA translocase FtsK/SpoIIIE-like protein
MDVAVVKPRKHPFAHSAWRYFVTGRPLWGPGDNATFLHDATVDHRDRPVPRLTRARWRRLARRHAGITVPAGLMVCDWRAAAAYAGAMAAAGGVYGGMAVRAWWPLREVRAEFVVPTWTVVAKILGVPARRRDAYRAIILPANWGLDVDVAEVEPFHVRIHLPAVPLDEGIQKRIASAAGQRLGIAEVDASWTIRGASAYVDLAPRVRVPSTLRFCDVRTQWLDASATRPLVGMAAKRTPVYADLDNDGPHIGVSGGTGTGKSTLLRIILAKRVRSGAALVVCDYKVISHRWARRIAQTSSDRVLYVVDMEPISDAIMAVFTEFERRRELLKDDPTALVDVRPVDLLVEELNTLADMLRKWWGHERRRMLAEDPKEYVPAVPPCVDALAALVQMGRELNIRVHFAAQRLDAAALSPRGGGAIRESITNRFLAGYTKKTWDMLCAGIPFQVFPGGPRGIWMACVSGEVTPFRVPPLSDDEAYELAMGGVEPSGPVLGAARWVPEGRQSALVTLGEAWELVGAPSLDALRWLVRDRKLVAAGRKGNAHLYDMRELTALYSKDLERL